MTRKRALNLAVKALLAQTKPLNWDANIYQKGLAGNLPGFEHAWRRREALRLAAACLQDLEKGDTHA